MFKLEGKNLFLAGVISGCLVTSTTLSANQYLLQDLGPIAANSGESVHINDAGEYTLPVTDDDGITRMTLVSGSTVKPVPGFGFANVVINELNNNGHAVGSALTDPLSGKHSALYYDGVTSKNIETINSLESTANGINDSNQIVGEIRLDYGKNYFRDNPTRGFTYDITSANMVLLDDLFVPTLPYVYPSMETAKSINDSGVITGESSYRDYCNNSISGCQAYTFDGTSINELGYLRTNKNDPVTSSGERSQGTAINSKGNVAGHSDRIGSVVVTPVGGTFDGLLDGIIDAPTPWLYPDPYHVFFYDGNALNDLGVLSVNGLEVSSIVSDMNDNDIIVGSTWSAEKAAFMVTPRTSIMALNELIPAGSEWTNLNAATDINNNDVIVGYGVKNGATHAFMLKPMTGADRACLHAPVKACEIVSCKVNGICN